MRQRDPALIGLLEENLPLAVTVLLDNYMVKCCVRACDGVQLTEQLLLHAFARQMSAVYEALNKSRSPIAVRLHVKIVIVRLCSNIAIRCEPLEHVPSKWILRQAL